ncbi:DUF4222 domain-containing protein [Lelliottia wanjuensis]|uniref:DUF4222 domain-containing protein n=1 Tax=Lelliottia wanjuensis TaxID=3050585 RepID=UPI00254A4AF8|nr:DUF4222 domain-containing protein [Lelliottia sp. V86_10]MDK9585447.1 DUF4222 domain-containing protein [Lelliottia sp. V86_10]
MRTSQEHRDALMERFKNAAKNASVNAPVERGAELFPGKRYRDGYGRMVTILRVYPLAVEYSREGYRGTCTMEPKKFKSKFTEVKS